MLRHLVLVISVLTSVLVGTSLAIHCWQCNSKFEPVCATVPSGPQDVAKLAEDVRKFYKNCDEEADAFINRSSTKYTFCRKQEQEIHQETRIVRGCGSEKSQGRDCYKTTNPSVKTYVCECYGDGCNSSSGLELSHFLIAISLFVSFLQLSKQISN